MRAREEELTRLSGRSPEPSFDPHGQLDQTSLVRQANPDEASDDLRSPQIT